MNPNAKAAFPEVRLIQSTLHTIELLSSSWSISVSKLMAKFVEYSTSYSLGRLFNRLQSTMPRKN